LRQTWGDKRECDKDSEKNQKKRLKSENQISAAALSELTLEIMRGK